MTDEQREQWAIIPPTDDEMRRMYAYFHGLPRDPDDLSDDERRANYLRRGE